MNAKNTESINDESINDSDLELGIIVDQESPEAGDQIVVSCKMPVPISGLTPLNQGDKMEL